MGKRTGGGDAEAARLRDSARRLAAEMDEAGHYAAAAYAQMAADAVVPDRRSTRPTAPRDEP